MPVKEIGRILGMSRAHVKVLLFRARARLAKLEGVRIEERDKKEEGDNPQRILYRGRGVKP